MPLTKMKGVAGLLLAFLCGISTSAVAEESPVEVQSVFIYSFLNYVTWPEGVQNKRLCVYGNSAIAETLERIRKKQQSDVSFSVQQLSRAEDAGACQILYLDSSLGASRIEAIVGALGHQPVLTISDMEHFSSESGIISMDEKDNKPHIIINARRARDAGLKVSSRLLAVAEVIN